MELTNLYVRQEGELPILIISGILSDGLRFRVRHVLLPLENSYEFELRDRRLSAFEVRTLENTIDGQRRVRGYPRQDLRLREDAAA